MVVFGMIGILVLIAFLCLSNGIAGLTRGKRESHSGAGKR